MKRITSILIFCFVSFFIVKSQENQNNNSENAIRIGNDTSLAIVDRMAMFQGNRWTNFQSWVESHVVYPEQLKRKGIQGRVVVSFSISSEGKIMDISITQSLHRLLDKEVIRVVESSPDWEPAIHEGRKVRQKFFMPVCIKI